MTGARYLLRFDDICPTMNWSIWHEVESIVRTNGLRPMLAVIPDNRDPHLMVAPAASDVWNRVRAWQAEGWTIAMHGYQHRFTSDASGLLQLNRYSEFAGHSKPEQYARLAAGVKIFEAEGIRPDVFIAPAHSFDWNTVQALRELGFRLICDGFCLWPSTDRFGTVWVPQQLWSFRYRPFGTWTICLHINAWQRSDLDSFRKGIYRYRAALTDVDTVASSADSSGTNSVKRLSGVLYGGAIHLKTRMGTLLMHHEAPNIHGPASESLAAGSDKRS